MLLFATVKSSNTIDRISDSIQDFQTTTSVDTSIQHDTTTTKKNTNKEN